MASYCYLHTSEADHGRDEEGMVGRTNVFYTAIAAEPTAASQSWVFPQFLHLPISAGGEVPVWPPAAGQLSRDGEVERAAQAQLELL